MDLNKEAEDHWKLQYIMALDESTKPYIIEDFIAGANSRYVQAQILQAQIEENKSALRMLKLHGNARNRLPVLMRINELEQQLDQLENQ